MLIKQKILAVITALSLVCTASVSAFARQTDPPTKSDAQVDVTLSLTMGSKYYSNNSGDVLMLEEMTVPYFDLALYGLEDYYYNPDCYTGEEQTAGTQEQAESNVTLLHAIIYATEVYALGIPEEEAGQGLMYTSGKMSSYLHITGEVGSTFISNFWEEGYNLNYYVNYTFPLGAPSLGATHDQILLHDGDHISIHRIADTTGNVSMSSFGYFEASGTQNFATVPQGEKITLDMKYTGCSYGTDTTAVMQGVNVKLYFTNVRSADPSTWTYFGTTDANGQIQIDTSEWEAGTYYIGTNSVGVTLDGAINSMMESTPAVFALTVEASGESGSQGGGQESVFYGDVNGDNTVNSTDASLVLCYEADLVENIDITAADVNKDGLVNPTDASLILCYEAGLITAFPTGISRDNA